MSMVTCYRSTSFHPARLWKATDYPPSGQTSQGGGKKARAPEQKRLKKLLNNKKNGGETAHPQMRIKKTGEGVLKNWMSAKRTLVNMCRQQKKKKRERELQTQRRREEEKTTPIARSSFFPIPDGLKTPKKGGGGRSRDVPITFAVYAWCWKCARGTGEGVAEAGGGDCRCDAAVTGRAA